MFLDDYDEECFCEKFCFRICGKDQEDNCQSIKTDNSGHLDIVATDLDIRNLNCEQDSVGACGLSVNDSTHQPIKTDVNRVVATLSSASTHSQIGQLYSVVQNIASQDNEVLQVLFSNTSNKTMYLDKIMCSSVVFPVETPRSYVESILITIIKNVNITALGTPLFPTNLNTSFPDSPSVSVTRDPSALGGTVLFNTRPLGEFASIDFDGRVVVAPNTNIIVQFVLNNPATGLGVDFWATITWYEL